jgi:RNA polymerase sigma-B factor
MGPIATLDRRNAVGTHGGLDERARDDLKLLLRYRTGDAAARDELVSRMLPVVRQLARRYDRGSEQLDDLVQVGCVGLVKAIERFDPERSPAFIRYAVPTIRRFFRDTGWAAHVPRGMQELALEIREHTDQLSRTLGRSPTPAELAQELGISVEEVLEGIEASTAYHSTSLDAPCGGDGEEERGAVKDAVGEADTGYELVENVVTILPALRVLPRREQEIIRLRFFEDLTQSEIADRVGISQMHVSRLLRRALGRVRAIAQNERRGPVGEPRGPVARHAA